MTNAATEIQAKLIGAANARQRGQLADELQLLDQALAINPLDPIALNARGMRALADEQPADAANYFSQATEIEPRQPTLWMNLATAARMQGDFELERTALDHALDIDRLHFMAVLRKAELEERCGKATEAVVAWSNVVQFASSTVDRASAHGGGDAPRDRPSSRLTGPSSPNSSTRNSVRTARPIPICGASTHVSISRSAAAPSTATNAMA